MILYWPKFNEILQCQVCPSMAWELSCHEKFNPGAKFHPRINFCKSHPAKNNPSLQFFILPYITILLLAPRVSLFESASPRMEDDSSEDIVDFVYFYLTGKGYPSNSISSMKRQIRQRSSKFVVVNGELHYKKGQDQVSWATSRLRLYRT